MLPQQYDKYLPEVSYYYPGLIPLASSLLYVPNNHNSVLQSSPSFLLKLCYPLNFPLFTFLFITFMMLIDALIFISLPPLEYNDSLEYSGLRKKTVCIRKFLLTENQYVIPE